MTNSFKDFLLEAQNVRTLKKWYAEYNKKYFDNKLPDITIKLESMSFNKFGVVVTQGQDHKIVRLALSKTIFHNFPDIIAQDVLMHEMIHVALVSQGTFETSGSDKMHGKEFIDLAKKISVKYGREIPHTEALKWLDDKMKEEGLE